MVSYKSKSESARKRVKETFQILRNTLDTKENELLERINEIEEKNEKIYNEYNSAIQRIKVRIAQVSKEFDALLSPPNNVAVLQQFSDFKNEFEKINVDIRKSPTPSFLQCALPGLDEYKNAVNEQLSMLKCVETCKSGHVVSIKIIKA